MILGCLLQLAEADGLVVAEEEAWLETAAVRLGLTSADLQALEDAPPPGLDELSTPERQELLEMLIELSLCDGNRDLAEARYLTKIAQRLGFSRDDLKRLEGVAERRQTEGEMEKARARAEAALREL